MIKKILVEFKGLPTSRVVVKYNAPMPTDEDIIVEDNDAIQYTVDKDTGELIFYDDSGRNEIAVFAWSEVKYFMWA